MESSGYAWNGLTVIRDLSASLPSHRCLYHQLLSSILLQKYVATFRLRNLILHRWWSLSDLNEIFVLFEIVAQSFGICLLNTYLCKTANTFHDCGPSDTDLPILMRTQYGPSLLINNLKIKHVKPGWKWVKGISRSRQKQTKKKWGKRNKARNTDILIFQPNRQQFRFLRNCPPTPPLSQH